MIKIYKTNAEENPIIEEKQEIERKLLDKRYQTNSRRNRTIIKKHRYIRNGSCQISR